MICPHVVLGLRWDAGDKEVRQRYLELVRAHPPSKDPERFELIATAYEMMKNRRSRVDTHLFAAARSESFEGAISDLEIAAGSWRPPGLREICSAEGE